MKRARWEDCSEISIACQIRNLQEVEVNLLEFPISPGEPETTGNVIVAVSFIRQAMQMLSQTTSGSTPKV